MGAQFQLTLGGEMLATAAVIKAKTTVLGKFAFHCLVAGLVLMQIRDWEK